VVFTAANRYVASHYNGNGSPPFDSIIQIPSYSVLDLRMALRDSASWEVTVYANNVLDRFNITGIYAPAFEPFTRAEVLPPRMLGVRASYRW
jgi:outer membrane receptor protein involved in Fe transport